MNRIHATHAHRPQGAWSFVREGMHCDRPLRGLLMSPGPGEEVLAKGVTR